MKLSMVFLASALLCASVSMLAQEEENSGGASDREPAGDHSAHLDMPAETVADHAPEAQPAARPDTRPAVDHGDHTGAGGGSGGPVDPYPGLTAANKAYDQAVATWQQAYDKYQQALQEQKAIRDKYVDENNTVREGLDYYTAVAVVHAADVKVDDAWLELDRAEKARNEAYSRAAAEFKNAMEQYYGGGGGSQAGQGGVSPSPGPSNQGPRSDNVDRKCGHC